MCAIAGVCDSEHTVADARVLAEMIGMLRHRGPDDHGTYADKGVGLANARLSIIDLTGGKQPLHNEDSSLWITFNGEIFNYLELRQELISRGHRFATQTDTEVVIHLYEERGDKCVELLNGQWALAIWDTRQRKLFLSRDRLGVRPLFYTQLGSKLIFASEIKSIFAFPGVAREIDPVALDQIFTFWCTLPPRTIFKGVYELAAGHSLSFQDGKVRVSPYWHLDFSRAASDGKPERAYGEELEALLTDAVRLRLRSDVPVGTYLSGGLDSTIITALTRKLRSEQPRTFSIGFGVKHLDESPFQQKAIAFLDTAHEQMWCQRQDVVDAFADVIWHTETPMTRAAPAPMYLLSALVRENEYKVVLTGEGADEIFGGYDIYKEAKIRRFWAAQPTSPFRAHLLRRLYPYQNQLQRQPDAYLQHFFRVNPDDLRSPFFSHLPRWQLTSALKTFFSGDLRSQLLTYDGLAELAAQLPTAYNSWPPFAQAQYLETTLLLPGYILSSQGDRVAMAHAVEARHPFLDFRLVEFATRMPCNLKMKVLNEKHILKQTFSPLLPPCIAERPKQPYRAPDGSSFYGGRKPPYFEELLASDKIRSNGIFDERAVSKLLAKFEAGHALGVKDDMALIGILSTQLVVDQFISHFRKGGSLCERSNKNYAAS